jgi:hypothetical protein
MDIHQLLNDASALITIIIGILTLASLYEAQKKGDKKQTINI